MQNQTFKQPLQAFGFQVPANKSRLSSRDDIIQSTQDGPKFDPLKARLGLVKQNVQANQSGKPSSIEVIKLIDLEQKQKVPVKKFEEEKKKHEDKHGDEDKHS